MANLMAAAGLLQFYGADFLDKQLLLVQTIPSLHFLAYLFCLYTYHPYQFACMDATLAKKVEKTNLNLRVLCLSTA